MLRRVFHFKARPDDTSIMFSKRELIRLLFIIPPPEATTSRVIGQEQLEQSPLWVLQENSSMFGLIIQRKIEPTPPSRNYSWCDG